MTVIELLFRMANLRIASPSYFQVQLKQIQTLVILVKIFKWTWLRVCNPQPSWLGFCLYSRCINCMEA